MRAFALALVTACSFVAAPAAAQERDTSEDVLASINAESSAATGLYVGGVITHVGGLALAGFFTMFTVVACTEEEPNCWTRDAALASLIVAGVGLAAIGVAIGLDVDSGSRRRGLARGSTVSDLTLQLGLTGVSLIGRF